MLLKSLSNWSLSNWSLSKLLPLAGLVSLVLSGCATGPQVPIIHQPYSSVSQDAARITVIPYNNLNRLDTGRSTAWKTTDSLLFFGVGSIQAGVHFFEFHEDSLNVTPLAGYHSSNAGFVNVYEFTPGPRKFLVQSSYGDKVHGYAKIIETNTAPGEELFVIAGFEPIQNSMINLPGARLIKLNREDIDWCASKRPTLATTGPGISAAKIDALKDEIGAVISSRDDIKNKYAFALVCNSLAWFGTAQADRGAGNFIERVRKYYLESWQKSLSKRSDGTRYIEIY